jgi:hypothetical protein
MAWLCSGRVGVGAAALLVGALALAGCGAEDRNTPDEFSVTTRAPLIIPNDFSLPPPRPGAERAQDIPPRLQAQAALVPELALQNESSSDPPSPGEQALLKATGRPAPPNIRQLVDRQAARDAEAGIADAILFWRGSSSPGTALDPAKEAARLRRQQATQAKQGAPASGGTTPQPAVQGKRGGLFDWLF